MRQLDMSMTPEAKRRRQLAKIRKLFATAREQMQQARVYRERRQLRSLRSAILCARENVRLGRKLRSTL